MERKGFRTIGWTRTKAPNGLSYELKSVSFHKVKDKLVPKETMAITMINPKELKEHDFFKSHCWAKLKSMVFCAVMWHGKNATKAELLEVESLDFLEDDDLIKEIKADYDFIRNKLIKEGFDSLTGKDWLKRYLKLGSKLIIKLYEIIFTRGLQTIADFSYIICVNHELLVYLARVNFGFGSRLARRPRTRAKLGAGHGFSLGLVF